MKQQEIYQQILDELEPGAQEYDRMMAAGLNPAAKLKRRRRALGYAAAACLACAIAATTYVLWRTEKSNQPKPLAQQTATHPTPAPAVAPQPTPIVIKGEDHLPPPPPQQTTPLRHHPKSTTAPAPAPPPQPQPQPTSPNEAEIAQQKERIEAEVMRTILERQICNEIIDKSIQQPNENQIILCAL